MENISDIELVKRFKKKRDSRSFSELMNRYRVRLYSYIIRTIKNRDAADDVYQEVWLKISRSIDKYEERNKFSNFLFFVATNTCYDYLRKLKRENENVYREISDSEGRDFMENIKSDTKNPEYEAVEKEKRKKVKTAIDTLPNEQKEVVLLRSEGFSFKEISNITGVSINSLLSRMRYAVNKLKTSLK